MIEPRISVVVPFFNRQRYLAACIEGLLAQEDAGGPVEISSSTTARPTTGHRWSQGIRG